MIRFSRVRSCWHVLSSVMESKAAPTQSSGPSGTDRFFLRHSRHFVPGYSHESLRDNSSWLLGLSREDALSPVRDIQSPASS